MQHHADKLSPPAPGAVMKATRGDRPEICCYYALPAYGNLLVQQSHSALKKPGVGLCFLSPGNWYFNSIFQNKMPPL